MADVSQETGCISGHLTSPSQQWPSGHDGGSFTAVFHNSGRFLSDHSDQSHHGQGVLGSIIPSITKVTTQQFHTLIKDTGMRSVLRLSDPHIFELLKKYTVERNVQVFLFIRILDCK